MERNEHKGVASAWYADGQRVFLPSDRRLTCDLY